MTESKVRHWRYAIKEGETGWGIFFMDETGTLSILSDYGTWSYRWSTQDRSFRRFLIEADDCYLSRCLNKERPVMDEETTKRELRKEVGRRIREGKMTMEEAREELELIKGIYTSEDWFDYRHDTQFDYETIHNCYCTMDPPLLTRMLNELWPLFVQALRESYKPAMTQDDMLIAL